MSTNFQIDKPPFKQQTSRVFTRVQASWRSHSANKSKGLIKSNDSAFAENMGFGLQSLSVLFPRIPVHPFQHPRSSKSLQHTSTYFNHFQLIFSQHPDRKASGATVTSSSPCAKSRWDSWAFRLSVGQFRLFRPRAFRAFHDRLHRLPSGNLTYSRYWKWP